MSTLADEVDVVVGVDTHKHSHTAALVAPSGAEMRSTMVATTRKGYVELVELAAGTAGVGDRGGVSSYGAGLCWLLARLGERVIEIDHPARPARRNGSNSDTLDAVRAAREALARPVLGEPRRGADREALRVLHVTRESAVHARTQAINAVHALVVTAPDAVRDGLRDLTTSMMLGAVALATCA